MVPILQEKEICPSYGAEDTQRLNIITLCISGMYFKMCKDFSSYLNLNIQDHQIMCLCSTSKACIHSAIIS